MNLPSWLNEPAEQLSAMIRDARVPHAVLIHGPIGWGESILASHFALSLLKVDLDRDARALAHPDLRWVEPDEATLKVEQIRGVSEFMMQTARQGGAKVVVVNQAHRMTTNAANALLKTLEEPPDGGYLVLVTHTPQRLPPTVLSRCQRIQVRGVSNRVVEAWLGERGFESRDLASLMVELGGAPYAVLEALEREDQPIWGVLGAVRTDKTSALDAAAAWRQADLVDLSDRWLRHVHRLAREATDARALLEFADELAVVRIAAMTNSGLSRQVQLERLLLAWRSMPRAE